MRELDQLRRQERDRTKELAKLDRRIAEEQAVADAGGALRELRLLQQDREETRAVVESLRRRIATLEAEEGRAHDLKLALEQDALVEEAHARRLDVWQQASADLDGTLRRVLAAEDAFSAAAQAFLDTTERLAPVRTHTIDARPKNEALLAELRARGATLEAISTIPSFTAFSVGGGGALKLPEPWGSLLKTGVDGLYRARALEAEHRNRENLERRVAAKVGAVVGGAA